MEDILGISVLNDPGVEANFDLVAVHGIKGHPYRTWTHPNGERWLESFLPIDFPNTRILTFGYNAQVFTSSKGCITDFAEQLLQSLTSVRQLRDENARPIVFVCHSLGGLVVKKALLLADKGHDAAALKHATRAVVFMGTPHRGSQLASYADTIITCIKAIGFKANATNIQQLRLNSDHIDELGSQFGSLLQIERIKVLSFYELKPMKIAGISESVIVPKSSAKLGLGPPLETVIPVDADHRQIAQFSSRNSNQYNVVRSNLAQILSSQSRIRQINDKASSPGIYFHEFKTANLESELPETTDGWTEVLMWLHAFRNQLGSMRLKERTEGTCQWIDSNESFQNWRFEKGSAGLWVFGKPGVGKTMLSDYISENLRSESDCTILALRCHSYRSLNDPIHALLRDLLFQALESPHMAINLKKRLLSIKAHSIDMLDIAFDTIFKVIDDTIRSTPNNTYLIMDGVNELDSRLIEHELFMCTIGDLSQSIARCKILILSRNTTKLEKFLKGWETMEMSTSDVMSDIATFLNFKIAGMEHLSQRRDEVMQRLLSGSKGLFLWADLALSELEHFRTWNEVEDFLEKGNPGLDITYATIIEELNNSSEGLRQIRARALPLASVACRPIKLEEMIELLAVEISKGSVDPGNKLLGGWNTLSRACGPLLQLNDLGAIELIHVSAKEFLKTYPLGQDSTGECAETEMACLCLSYLNFTVSGRNVGADVEVDVDSLNKQYPLLEYASQFWSDHFLRSEKIAPLQLALLDNFLTSPCSVAWTSSFYPHFALKCGESHGTINSAQQSIIANLQAILRMSGSMIDASLSDRCIKRLDRLLLDSWQDSLRIEMFRSGLTINATIEKRLRLAQCYEAMNETKIAKEIASETFQTANDTLGYIHPLTIQLKHAKLALEVRLRSRSGGVESFHIVLEYSRLLEAHIEVFGQTHRETNYCRKGLASAYLKKREFSKAREILEPLHRRMIETSGCTSRITQSVANSLAVCANMQGDYDYAESVLNTSPGLVKAAAEPLEIDITRVPIETLYALSIFASVLGARDEDRRSEMLHQRAIDGLMVLKGPKTLRIYESAINKGQALRDQFKYKEARKHYDEWLRKSDQYLGQDSKHSRIIRERLVDLDQREQKWKEMSQSLNFQGIQGLHDWNKPLNLVPFGFVIVFAMGLSLWSYFFGWMGRI